MRAKLRPGHGALLVAAAALLAYSGSLANGFVNWDEPFLLPGGRPYALGLELLVKAFRGTLLVDSYQPVPVLLLAVVNALFGFSPAAYHAFGLLCHAASALALYACGLGLGFSVLPAALAAAAFAAHPLHAELVCWAAAFPDALAVALALWAAALWLRGRARTALVLAVVSAFCRWEVAALPLALVLLDLARGRGLRLRDKLPFAAVSVLAAAVNALAKTGGDGGYAAFKTTAAEWAFAPLFYLSKLAFPSGLLPVYELGSLVADSPLPAAFWPFALLAASAGTWVLRRRAPALWRGWLFFLAAVAPTVILAPPGSLLGHDRYAYASSAGLFLALAALLEKRPRLLAPAAAGALALALAARSQTAVWRDTVTLWTPVVERQPAWSWGYNNLGGALAAQGREEEAIALFTRQLEHSPEPARMNLARAWHNLGVSRWGRGDRPGAIAAFEEALRWSPGLEQTERSLAEARALSSAKRRR